MSTPTPIPLPSTRRRDTLLREEILPCDDPVCCCEPEPRWLRLQHDQDFPDDPSEWDFLDRAPCDEL
jgi:hypothetical protein